MNIKFSSFLEIGCSGGEDLSIFKKMLKKFLEKINFTGIDVSKEAIKFANKKYKNIDFFELSSLEINKINKSFDMINLGWMMYLLDRNEIFNQFNIIYNKLNNGGYLSVIDFQPNFPHTNINEHSGKFRSYKTDYSIFLKVVIYLKKSIALPSFLKWHQK